MNQDIIIKQKESLQLLRNLDENRPQHPDRIEISYPGVLCASLL